MIIVRNDEWMQFFREHSNKKLFSTADIYTMTDEKKSSLKVQLTRMVDRGVIRRPVRGWYINPLKTVSPEELSMVIRIPSYLSMEYALSKHGILSQRTYVLTLMTTKVPRAFQTSENEFEYHQIRGALFFGYRTDRGVALAEPEKALLDLIYIRSAKGRSMRGSGLDSLLDDMYLEDMDRKRLSRYAEQYDRRTRSILIQRSIIG